MSGLRIDHVLRSSVANSGTVGVPVPREADITEYLPSGRLEYDSGGMIPANQYSFSNATTVVTVTNSTGSEWASGRRIVLILARKSDTRLDMLEDVEITNVQDGQTLTYDSGTGKWVNA